MNILMCCFKNILILSFFIILTSCQLDNQSSSDENGTIINKLGNAASGEKITSNLAPLTVCDQEPPYVCGGCLSWDPPSLDFGVVTQGASKTKYVDIVVRAGVIHHFLESVCQYGFQYNDEISVYGYRQGQVPSPSRQHLTVTFTPVHGPGIRSGSIWLQYYQWLTGIPPSEYPRWACELPITVRVVNSGGGGVIH